MPTSFCPLLSEFVEHFSLSLFHVRVTLLFEVNLMSENKQLTEESLELSKMFHEIKNPLTLINSSLQLIESDHPEVQDFKFWKQTMKDLQSLRLLIDELSSFQKSSYVRKSLINLFDFTEDLVESTEGYLLETGTPLTIDYPADDIDFYADSAKLQHAIVNLLKNAAESSEKGSPILLHITVRDQRLYISVTDHGCGMSKEQIQNVFEPFHTTKSYGTGLGLPIVKKIVSAHGGTLSIESFEKTGTTVTICIPVSQESTVC